MKFTLKDYQEDAVRGVLERLAKARKHWRDDGDRYAFALAATTGAGKTVMAAAGLEALFLGSETYDFEPDPGAVVIWFSDDPSLNEQTRFRLGEASDGLQGRFKPVETDFVQEKFDPGKIYFLNTQKLGKKSLLVRGHEPDAAEAAQAELGLEMRPDLRAHTIWDTIRNTIEDPNLTLYLVLDEAHRGMGTPSKAAASEKSTIVRRLINGAGSVPAIPVVWGISATIERFTEAMAGMQNRNTFANVEVDAAKVQASGLLKDTIVLDIPKDAGQYDTVLLRRATEKLKESTAAWAAYAEREGDAAPVVPLMVFQVPNAPDHEDIGRALKVILDTWPALTPEHFAHVFGEHSTQTFGPYSVPYLSPEHVQDATDVRVLIAKDAISTGWDCPRAEVMVSFRPARDRTHITQLMGRMVRTPLARRIPGDDRLNAVACLLPFFDATSVSAVADALMYGGDGGPPLPGRRVLINPKEMTPNPAVPDAVWDAFVTLPSQRPPQREAKPVRRLTLLAHELAADGLLADAGKRAYTELIKALNAARVRYADEITAARSRVLVVEGQSLRADLKAKQKSLDRFFEDADYAVVEAAYGNARRTLGADLSKRYAETLAAKNITAADSEEALMAAHADIAALGLVPDVKTYLEAEAAKLANAWQQQHRVAIKGLTDKRRAVYDGIKQMSTEPQDSELEKPDVWVEPTEVRELDGTVTPLQTYPHHLMCDADGLFPADLNAWETRVLKTEMQRPGFVAWYRNPPRAGSYSLGIAYGDGDDTRIVRPDFLIFSRQSDGSIAVDIVDPHGTQFSDALPKLRGLAAYAELHAGKVRRVDAIAEVGEKLRVLDLTDAKVRDAVSAAADARSLYEGPRASEY
ncbi:DEAD/DEAH box helicase [Thiohalocapsa sp. ML1]|uniref:DEAD/DEAH box helicase n=1 Tax=Thiohalocapsa sp. ML1 TaxID=1431688 RepID=UPI0007323039|nr:DEAD/DEAH box helicase family protein [Thiohalocapsa sp. ML1]